MRHWLAISVLTLAPVLAAQGRWEQCGGKDWTGGKECSSGWQCRVQNPWYSQCLPKTGHDEGTMPTTLKKLPQPQATKAPVVHNRIQSNDGSLPKASGVRFVVDGVRGYFPGTNFYPMAFLTSNADIDGVFDELQKSGLKILRVWGFNTVNSVPSSGQVYFQALVPGQGAIINEGADGLQRLDYVVKSAEKHGIKLIIPLVNNWKDYGGIPAYCTYYGISHEAWYTHDKAQGSYQHYVKSVVSRYIGSPAIFAWELANEPRCQGCDTSIIYNWAKATSAYIKNIDSGHMVALGDEGFGVNGGDGTYPYGHSDGVDFDKNLGIDSIDLGTFHMYPEAWKVDSERWPIGWIQTHAAACIRAKKPCILEEYGHAPPHKDFLPAWQNAALHSPGISGDMFWALGTVLASGKDTDNGEFTVSTQSPGQWKMLVTDHVTRVGKLNAT